VSTRIRLARGGKKKTPFYRIVVADKRMPRDGRFIERLGSYQPTLKENKTVIDVERAQYWLGTGAQPSETVQKLLSIHGFQFNEKGVMVSFTPVAELPPIKERKPRLSKKALAKQAAAEEAKAEEAAKPAEEPKAEEAAPVEAAAPAEEPKAEEAAPAEEAGEEKSEG